MTRKEIGCALIVRESDAGPEVLLEQRPATNTVMPGLWELPAMAVAENSATDAKMTVRHAIMQVNYVVRVCEAREQDLTPGAGGQRRWVSLVAAREMALTGLARKVLGKVKPGPHMKTRPLS